MCIFLVAGLDHIFKMCMEYTIHISLSVFLMRHNVILIYPQDHVCGLAEANQPGLDCLSNEQVINQTFSSMIWISMHFELSL